MQTTTGSQVSLNLPEQADTVATALTAINANTTALASWPVPFEFVSNDYMSGIKLANGYAICWGHRNYGTSLPCSTPSDHGYLSNEFTITYPVSFVSEPACVVTANCYPWTDVTLYNKRADLNSYTGWFFCTTSDASASNTKEVDLVVCGRWV